MLATAFWLSLGFALTGPGDPVPVSSNTRLQRLPDGLIKRQFILDCTGCHQFDAQVTQPNGTPRMPSRGALVRHLSIDPKTHDLWLAYGASPGRIAARVARLRVGS